MPRILLPFLVIVSTCWLLGCDRKVGNPADVFKQETSLIKLLSRGEDYDGLNVVVEGFLVSSPESLSSSRLWLTEYHAQHYMVMESVMIEVRKQELAQCAQGVVRIEGVFELGDLAGNSGIIDIASIRSLVIENNRPQYKVCYRASPE